MTLSFGALSYSLALANYPDSKFTGSARALAYHLNAMLTRSSLALATKPKASLLGAQVEPIAHGRIPKIKCPWSFILQDMQDQPIFHGEAYGSGSGAQCTAEPAC